MLEFGIRLLHYVIAQYLQIHFVASRTQSEILIFPDSFTSTQNTIIFQLSSSAATILVKTTIMSQQFTSIFLNCYPHSSIALSIILHNISRWSF